MAAAAAAILAPVLTELAKNGLGLLSGAIQAKGKQVIEDKLGVKIPANPAELTPEKLQELAQAQFTHEEFLINAQLEEKKIDVEAEKAASSEVTARWKADITSDSWFSKNVRPLGLLWVFIIITLMVICDAAGITFDESSVSLVQYIGSIIVGAYFVGRTLEKGTAFIRTKKPTEAK